MDGARWMGWRLGRWSEAHNRAEAPGPVGLKQQNFLCVAAMQILNTDGWTTTYTFTSSILTAVPMDGFASLAILSQQNGTFLRRKIKTKGLSVPNRATKTAYSLHTKKKRSPCDPLWGVFTCHRFDSSSTPFRRVTLLLLKGGHTDPVTVVTVEYGWLPP